MKKKAVMGKTMLALILTGLFIIVILLIIRPIAPMANSLYSLARQKLGIEEEKGFEDLSDSEKKEVAEEFYNDCYEALNEKDCKNLPYECDDAFELCKKLKVDYIEPADLNKIKGTNGLIWQMVINYGLRAKEFGRQNKPDEADKMFDKKIEALELSYELEFIESYSYWYNLGSIYSDPQYTEHDYNKAIGYFKKTIDINDYIEAKRAIKRICDDITPQPSACKELEEEYLEEHEKSVIVTYTPYSSDKSPAENLHGKLKENGWPNAEILATTNWANVESYGIIFIIGGPSGSLFTQKCTGVPEGDESPEFISIGRKEFSEGKIGYCISGKSADDTVFLINWFITNYVNEGKLPSETINK